MSLVEFFDMRNSFSYAWMLCLWFFVRHCYPFFEQRTLFRNPKLHICPRGYLRRRPNVNNGDAIAPKRASADCGTSHVIAGMFVAIFKCKFGDSRFIELAQPFSEHTVVLFLRRARER